MAKITDRFVFKAIEHGMVSDGVIFVTGPPKVKKHDLVEAITKNNYVRIDMSDPNISIFSKLNSRAFIRSLPPYSLLKNIDEVYHLAPEFKNLVRDLRIKYKGYFPNIFILVSSIADSQTINFGTRFDSSARKIYVPTLLSAETIPYGDINFLHNIFHREYYPDEIENIFNLDEVALYATFPDLVVKKKVDNISFFDTILEKYIDKYFQDKNIIEKFKKFVRILAANIGHSLNERKISKDLDITGKEYMHFLEIAYSTNLFYSLNQWSPGESRTDPKLLFLIDTNFALYLLQKEQIKDCNNQEILLHNFVCSELMKQTYLNLNYKLYHFQKYETCPVDFIIEDQYSGEIIPINLILKEFVGPEDLSKIESFKNHAHQACSKAFILYKGTKIIKLRPEIIALPIASLWYSGVT